MKLNEYAKKQGISYKTAWRWWKSGYLKGFQMPTGTIIVEDKPEIADIERREKCEE